MIEDVEVPEGWRRVRLGEIIEIFDRERIPLDSEYRVTIKGGFPYCGATGVIDYINDYIFDGEYVLIAEDGGRFNRFEETAYIMKGKFWANNHVHIVIGKRSVLNNLFLMYSIIFQDISYYISGSTREKLNQQLLKSVYILFPSSLSEQHKIAEILGTVDNAIERTDTIIEKYKQIKQGLMQDLLTRGVVENDELGVMNYELRDEKKHGFKDSPLGRIPEEWMVVEFKDICKVRQGLQIAIANRFKEPGHKRYIYITILYLNSNDKEKDAEYIQNPPRSVICRKNDILMTRTGNTGMVITDVDGVFHNNFFLVDYDKKEVDKMYLFYYLNIHWIQEQIRALAGTTTIPDLNHNDFYSLKFLKPPLPEQHRIASILSQMAQTIEKEQKCKQKLESIKQGIMEDLLTGKVRVNHLIKEGMKNVQTA